MHTCARARANQDDRDGFAKKVPPKGKLTLTRTEPQGKKVETATSFGIPGTPNWGKVGISLSLSLSPISSSSNQFWQRLSHLFALLTRRNSRMAEQKKEVARPAKTADCQKDFDLIERSKPW